MNSSNSESSHGRRLKNIIVVEEDEGSSSETDTSMVNRIINNLMEFKVESRVNIEEESLEKDTDDEASVSETMEILESENLDAEGSTDASVEEASDGTGGYLTDEDTRFPRNEKEVYKCKNVRVVHMGYKRTQTGKIYASVYRCRGHEIELPYVSEEEANKDLYKEASERKANYIPDIHLSEEKRKTMGIPLYQSSYSKLNKAQEAEIRMEYNIGEDFEMIFPEKENLASEAPADCLIVYVAQLKAGLRFPLHPLFKDILRFWELQLGQITPNGIRVVIGFIILCKMYGVCVSLDVFRHYFYISQKFGSKDGRCFHYFTRRPKSVQLIDQPTSVHNWKSSFFFLRHKSFKEEDLVYVWNLRNKMNNFCKRYDISGDQARSVMVLNNRHSWLDVRLNWPSGILEAAGLAGERKTNLKLLSKNINEC